MCFPLSFTPRFRSITENGWRSHLAYIDDMLSYCTLLPRVGRFGAGIDAGERLRIFRFMESSENVSAISDTLVVIFKCTVIKEILSPVNTG